MKNRKKLLVSICSILTLTCGMAGLAACQSNNGKLDPAPKEDEYEYNYTTNYEGENDPGIEIDGKLDEEAWQGKNWYTNHFYADVNDTMPSLNVTAFTTEYGVYMGIKVRDDNVVYIGSMDQSRNTTFEFYYYADKSDTVLADRDYSSRHAFMLDCGGELYSTCERMKRAIIVDGEVNSGKTTGATVEIFVPWSEMRVDVSDGVYPQNLFLLPKYRPILKGSTASTLMYPMPFNPMHHMKNYYVFDASGYTDADQEGVEIGDSFNGLAKTGNWDLESLDEGKISVTSGVEFNSIYYKDVFAESFVAETMIYPLEGHTGYDGRYAGFWLLSTNGNYYTMMVDMRTNRYVKAQDGRYTLKEFGLVTLTEAHRYWEQVTKLTKDNPDVDVDVAPATSGVRFKIIKDANTIHYFINDEYFYSETLDFVQGKVYVGLFNMNVYAEYEEFWCMPLEGEELKAELNTCDIYKINAQTTTAGGYVTLDKEYAVAGDDIALKIVTDSGYKVSSVICNGEDITENVSEDASKGVYLIEDVNENTDFDVTFEKIENPVTYKGKLFIDGEGDRKEYVSGSVILVNKAANEQRYELASTANRGFELKMEAGEYELYVDGYVGSVSITLTETVTDVQEIDINSLASVKTTNIHYVNMDFVESTVNTVKGRQGQWFVFDTASDKVYTSARIYNYDLDGFTVETEDGANVQFYFGYQGFFMLKDHDWVFVDGMKSWDQYGYYNNDNKMKILNPTNVESLDGSLVEIAIADGYLYVAINGIGKAQFNLSEFNESFTAAAKYHVGFCTYNGTNAKYPNGGARWEDITVKFGAAATNSLEEVKRLCAVEEYALGAELYSGTSMTKLDTTITYTAESIGAQVFDDVELNQNTNFVLYATVKAGMTAENVGFVVGTLGADNTKHLLFQWRRNQKDLYVWRNLGSWTGTADNIIHSDIGTNGAEIALVYKNGKYYAFLNGAQVCAIGKTIDNGWGGTLNVSQTIGTEGTLKVGLSIAFGMVQFTNVGYSTDKSVINQYQIDDMPSIGANVYSGGAYSEGVKADGSYRLDAKNGAGAAFFEDVEIAQGQDYVVYTTISNVSGDLVGFAVGTLAAPSSFAMSGWRESDIYVARLADKGNAWGWAGESIVDTITRKAAQIALVYKGGEYYFFVNGEQVAHLDKNMINKLAGIGATVDTVKVGFAVNWTGATSFSDWGYSTDEEVISKYVI